MKRGVWFAIVVGCFGLVAVPVKAISPDLWQNDLARAQTFRFLTMLATWALIFAAFVYEPGWVLCGRAMREGY